VHVTENFAVGAVRRAMILVAIMLSWVYMIAIIGGMILDERDRRRRERMTACKLT
jgi:hypothetical protein